MKSTHQADSMILGVLTSAAVAALFCGIFIFGLSGTPACAQTLGVPTINPDAKNEIKQPDAASVPRAGRPVLPADTLTAALPDRHGCFHLVHDFWEKVPCATEEQMKNLRSPQPPPPQCQPTITGFAPQPINAIISRAHSILGWTGQKISFTAPIVWGEVATQLSNPEASTENDVLAVTVNGKPVTIKTPNAFSIQTNTNNFPCLTCYDGYPFSAIPGCENSASKPGDTGWVQFVYSQSGSGTSANTFLCIWNIDVTIGKSNWGPNCHQTNPPPGYNRLCLTPPVSDNHTLKPLAGPGSTDEIAEVIGTVSCLPAAGCTLGLLAYLPWVEGDSGWWTVQTDDLVGLGQAGNWYSVGGTMLGEGSSSEAVFSDTTLHTYVVAYSCDTSGEQTRQGLLPQPCLPINGEDLFMVGVQNVQCVTGESNNLTCNGPALNFDCSYYGCSMDYISSIK